MNKTIAIAAGIGLLIVAGSLAVVASVLRSPQRGAACNCDQQGTAAGAGAHAQKLVIDFMYIDLETCDRCLGTEAALDSALIAARPALEALGTGVEVNKILVESAGQAAGLGFLSSPTIRIGGRDIAGELRETDCTSCGDICGEDTDCRVWSWQGRDYAAAPVGLLVEAILQAAVAPEDEAGRSGAYTLPDNLRKFFESKDRKAADESPPGREQAPCCPPAKGGEGQACGCAG